MNTIAETWIGLGIVDQDRDEAEIAMLKDAFYAGASAVLMLHDQMMQTSFHPADCVRTLEGWNDECMANCQTKQ